MTTTRRTVLRGAAWSVPVTAALTTAPAVAASSPAFDIDARVETPQPNNTAAKTVAYVFGNRGTIATTQTVTWTLTIVQTTGNTSVRNVEFVSADSDVGTGGRPGNLATLSAPTYSTNSSGYKVTTQTLTLYAGITPGDWVRIRIDFPDGGPINGYPDWTITATPQFTDANNANNSFSDKE